MIAGGDAAANFGVARATDDGCAAGLIDAATTWVPALADAGATGILTGATATIAGDGAGLGIDTIAGFATIAGDGAAFGIVMVASFATIATDGAALGIATIFGAAVIFGAGFGAIAAIFGSGFASDFAGEGLARTTCFAVARATGVAAVVAVEYSHGRMQSTDKNMPIATMPA